MQVTQHRRCIHLVAFLCPDQKVLLVIFVHLWKARECEEKDEILVPLWLWRPDSLAVDEDDSREGMSSNWYAMNMLGTKVEDEAVLTSSNVRKIDGEQAHRATQRLSNWVEVRAGHASD